MADTSGLGGFGKHHSSSTDEGAFGGVDELVAAIDAQVDESNKAAAGAFEFVERMRDIRGEGDQKITRSASSLIPRALPLRFRFLTIRLLATPSLRRLNMLVKMSVLA